MNSRMKLACTSAMSLALMLTGAAVSAQETVLAAVGEGTYLGRIVIGYDAEGAPIYAADNSSVLEGNALTSQGGIVRLDDILRQTPSVTTRLDVGQPAAAVAIRGLDGQGRVNMTLEGVPQNFRTIGHAAEGYAYIDPTMLSSVAITRGAAIENGGGLAGAADFRLLGFADVLDGQAAGGLARLSYGDNGEAINGLVAYGREVGAGRIMAAYSNRQSDEYENGDGDLVANSGTDTQSVLLRAEYDVSDTTTVNGVVTRFAPNFDAASYKQEVTADTIRLGVTHEASDLVDLEGNVFYTSTDTTYVGSLSANATGALGREMDTRTSGFNLTNTSVLNVGAWDWTSINGVEYNADSLGGADGGVNPTDGDISRLALFTQNILTAGKVELTFGLRAHNYELSGTKDGESVDVSAESVDPKVSIAYQLTDSLRPYVSAYQTMRAPSIQEVAPGTPVHAAGPELVYFANPDLAPERATGLELGVTFDRGDVLVAGDKLTGRVAIYQLDVENYIYSSTQSVCVPSPCRGMPVRVEATTSNLDGLTTSYGLELEANYDSDRFSAAASYARVESDLSGKFEGRDLQAPETLSLTVAGHFLDRNATVGATYSYTSGGVALNNEDNRGNPVSVESYEVVDLFASYAVNDSFRVNAKLSNVFDEAYTPWGSAALSTTPSAQGQNLFIGAEYRF